MGIFSLIFGKWRRKKARGLLQQGLKYAKIRRFKEAAESYKQAAANDPEYSIAYLNQGLALQDHYNEHIQDFSDADRLTIFVEIRDLLSKALELDDSLVSGWRCLGHVNRRLGLFVQAESAFISLQEATEGDPHLEKEIQDQLIQLKPLAEKARIIDRAVRLASEKDIAIDTLREFWETFEPIANEEDSDSRVEWAAGVLCRKLQDDEKAIGYFSKCVSQASQHTDAHRELASIYMKQGDMNQALQSSLKAYRTDPANPGLVCNVGVCYLSLGDLQEAEEFIRMARDMDSSSPIIREAWSALETAQAGSV